MEINEKMFLCAVVDGKDEDLQCMLVAKDKMRVRCCHAPAILCNTWDCPSLPEPKIETVHVDLQEVIFNGYIVGWVGKCTSCGKIYYRIY